MRKRLLRNLTPDRLAGGVGAWFRRRIDLAPLLALAAKKTVPVHRHGWVYLTGGAALFLFAMQVLSGCLLLLYYQPTMEAAHASVERIMTDVPFGWLVRSTHVWAADLFILSVLLHLGCVLFTKAYRKPRELTWLTGVGLLFLVLGFGFSGYLLPWTELSYSATCVGTEIPGTLPVVGDFIVHCLRGGEQVTGDTITRFSAAHVMILPLTLAGVLLAHLMLVQFQGVSLPLGTDESEIEDQRPFFSEFMLIDACVALSLFGLIVTLAVVWPAELGSQADLTRQATEGIKPEWYFLFMFQTLKYVPETVGVAFFTLGAVFLAAIPFLDRRASRNEKGFGFTAVVLAGLAYVAVFQIWGLLTPGVDHPAEELAADTWSLPGAIVSLTLLWAVIGFLIFCLRGLLRENTRVRKLYRNDG